MKTLLFFLLAFTLASAPAADPFLTTAPILSPAQIATSPFSYKDQVFAMSVPRGALPSQQEDGSYRLSVMVLNSGRNLEVTIPAAGVGSFSKFPTTPLFCMITDVTDFRVMLVAGGNKRLKEHTGAFSYRWRL